MFGRVSHYAPARPRPCGKSAVATRIYRGTEGKAVTEPKATLKPTVYKAFAGVKDVTGAANLALMPEEIAAATYLSAQGALTDKDAIMLAGSIQIVDAQHAAILHYVVGEHPQMTERRGRKGAGLGFAIAQGSSTQWPLPRRIHDQDSDRG